MKLRSRFLRLVASFLLMASWVGTQPAAAQEFENIRSDSEPLKSLFNAEFRKVRAIFLASPT